MLKRLSLILALTALAPRAVRAQSETFITPNFGATYTEQEQRLDEEAAEHKKKKGEFHASVEAGVAASFGRNNPFSGGMFYTGINGSYFHQVNRKLMVAAGFNLYNYVGTMDATTLNIYAMANYKFSDRVDGTFYLSHNFGNLRNNGGGYFPGLYGMGMGYSPMGGGMYGLGGYNGFCPSTTVGGSLGIKMKNGGKLYIDFSFSRNRGYGYYGQGNGFWGDGFFSDPNFINMVPAMISQRTNARTASMQNSTIPVTPQRTVSTGGGSSSTGSRRGGR